MKTGEEHRNSVFFRCIEYGGIVLLIYISLFIVLLFVDSHTRFVRQLPDGMKTILDSIFWPLLEVWRNIQGSG